MVRSLSESFVDAPMTATILAAALSCLTPQGETLHLGRIVYPDEAHQSGLPYARQWAVLALEGERIYWPSGQSLQLELRGGRVVRARTLVVRWSDTNNFQRIGEKSVNLEAGQLSGKVGRAGKWGTFICAGFDEPFKMDSVVAVRVGAAFQPKEATP